jgi:TPR repeat protein
VSALLLAALLAAAAGPAPADPLPTVGVLAVPIPEDARERLGVPTDVSGLFVVHVYRGPAARAGVRRGDVLVRLDGHAVTDAAALERMSRGPHVGRTVDVDVWRDGRTSKVRVTLAGSFEVYSLACDEGEPLGCFHLAMLHASGRGATRNPERAAGLLARSCDEGEPPGCAAQGAAYLSGDGRPRDLVRAASLFRQARDRGVLPACSQLGSMHLSGAGEQAACSSAQAPPGAR